MNKIENGLSQGVDLSQQEKGIEIVEPRGSELSEEEWRKILAWQKKADEIYKREIRNCPNFCGHF